MRRGVKRGWEKEEKEKEKKKGGNIP